MSTSETEKTKSTEKKSFELGVDEAEIEIEGYGVRHNLAIMGFLGLSSVYAMRVNLSVAIVAMVNGTTVDHNVSETESCPVVENYSAEDGELQTGEFDWDEYTQGLVLGAFYYGYALTNIVGGLASERFGGHLVNGLGVAFTSVLTVVSPFAARASSGWFIVVRMLEGCAEGVTFPALSNLVAKWYPANERSKFVSVIFAGMQFGTVVTLPISGWLSASSFLGGWPSVFYVFGASGVVWSGFWFCFFTDQPSDHPRISKSELEYIKRGCPPKKERLPVPWLSIFRSRYFWILAAMHSGNNWGFYNLLTELPTYLDKILHVNINNNGMLSAMPYFGAWIFSIVFSLIVDQMLARGSLSSLAVRRISMSFAGYGPMLCLIAICFANCNKALAIAFLILSGTLIGAMYCGVLSSHADLSPRFAGTLMGLTNTIATIPGFVAPAIAGILTQGNQTLLAWKIVFLISAAVYLVTVSLYVFFITTDRQPWDEPGCKEIEKRNSEPNRNFETTNHREEFSIKL